MQPFIRLCPLLLTRAACATLPPPPPAPPFRPDLAREWRDDKGAIHWPADDGFAAAPVLMVLPPGMLVVERPGEAVTKLDDDALARAASMRGDRGQNA